jgi:hypothetical protein
MAPIIVTAPIHFQPDGPSDLARERVREALRLFTDSSTVETIPRARRARVRRSSRPIPHARKDGSTLMDKMEQQ